MVRNSESWELGEPNLNHRGLPIIHDIVKRLGCIHLSIDNDLHIQTRIETTGKMMMMKMLVLNLATDWNT
ncbi:hypothetical protein GGI43DRAFT_404221 [Trichoderma evansii]